MKRKFGSCLWIKERPQETADFYLSVFEDAHQEKVSYFVDDLHGVKGDILTITLRLAGREFVLLHGGPEFAPTPAISYVVTCPTKEQLFQVWKQLSEDGEVLMDLMELPDVGWFGWTNDRYGFSWQLKVAEGPQSITPSLLFANDLYGKGAEAIEYWISSFGQGELLFKLPDEAGHIQLAEFQLFAQPFYLMESAIPHDFTFSLANSFNVYCQDQQEIDRLWSTITDEGEEYPCGWMVDKYGVAWQTVTEGMDRLFDYRNGEKAYQATMAMYEMKKIDIDELRRIYEQA